MSNLIFENKTIVSHLLSLVEEPKEMKTSENLKKKKTVNLDTELN